jgi:hypothetical protein
MQKNMMANLGLGLVVQLCANINMCQPAGAQNWQEQQAINRARQNAALQQQARDGYSPNGLSGQALQAQRWEQQWVTEHPGQPIPNPGQLQKMHTGEIQAEITAGGRQMWAGRQAELQSNYLMAKQMQQSKLAAQHTTWSPAQWANWDRSYDQSQQDQAEAYKRGIEIRREIDSEEMRRKALGF